MSASLFVGCSHSCGYFYDDEGQHKSEVNQYTCSDDNKLFTWGNNNYAEFYSKINDKKVIIYAMPGAGNFKFPDWIKICLDRHPEIDEVFVQSTYWNRYRIGATFNNDFNCDASLDHFLVDDSFSESIIRYTDAELRLPYIETCRKPSPDDYELFRGHKFPHESNFHYLEQLEKRYEYTKLWNELMTPLQQKDYAKDLLVIDTMCRNRGIPWYLWNINENCIIPENLEMYDTLQNCIRTPLSAEQYLLQEYDFKINEYKLDMEHYNSEVHEKIGKNYFSWLKNLTKT